MFFEELTRTNEVSINQQSFYLEKFDEKRDKNRLFNVVRTN